MLSLALPPARLPDIEGRCAVLCCGDRNSRAGKPLLVAGEVRFWLEETFLDIKVCGDRASASMSGTGRTSQRRDFNIVVLGAGGVGKSCLTAQFVQNVWIESYDPTIEDSYRKQIDVDGRQCMLEILDTAGTEQFTAMRELYMKTGQGFLLVFSITSQSSLYELQELREQIIRIKNDDNVPIVIVGNKSDLEEDRMVTRSRAFAVSQSWGNAPYYETSARRRANVDEVFIDLCRQIIRKDNSGYTRYIEEEYVPKHYKTPRPKGRSGKKKKKDSGCTIL